MTYAARFTLMKLDDPTYVRSEIDAKPEWELAFALSEIMNDNAPLGWGKYIYAAKCLLDNYNIQRKPAAIGGRVVRRAWMLWAMEQPDPKPSWLALFDDLSEPDQEVDCRIGAAIEEAIKVWAQPAHGMGIEEKEEQLRRLSEPPIPGKTDVG